MNFIIQLSFTNLASKSLETDVLILNYADKEKYDLAYTKQACLLDTEHPRTKFFLENLNIEDFQILSFNDNKQPIRLLGSSAKELILKDDSEIQWLLVLPKHYSLKQEELESLISFRFSYLKDTATKRDLITYKKENWYISPHTRIGGMLTTIRRMDAEKKLDIPTEWRSGVTISVESGKRTSEMAEQEREAFRQELIDAIRENYPSISI